MPVISDTDLKTTAVRLYGKPEKTNDGFLFVPVVFMEKKVMDYGNHKELPDFSVEDTYLLEQINGLPFILEHPVDENGKPVLVDSSNYKNWVKGVVVDPKLVEQNGIPVILALLKAWDPVVIELIETGELTEVSQGYLAKLVRAPDEFRGEKYEFLQTDFQFNHLALVDEGRNGSRVKVLYNQLKLNRQGVIKNMSTKQKRNNQGEPVEDPTKVLEPENPAPDELMNQDPAELDSRVTALEGSIQEIKAMLAKLVEPAAPSPEMEIENECGKKPTMNSINKAVSDNMIEHQRTYNYGRAFFGADIDNEIHRFNSLDGFRRHCLISDKSYTANEVERMNAIEVRAAFEIMAKHKAREINAPRMNGGGTANVNGDRYTNLSDLMRRK